MEPCIQEVIRLLGSKITLARKDRITSVVAKRNKAISVLLENVGNEGNVFAALRTMEGMGCLHLHQLSTSPVPVIKKKKKHTEAVAVGACNWISILPWNDPKLCVSHLKKHGYSLAVTSPSAKLSILDVDFNKKLIVAFGNECDGISSELAALSDLSFSLPMCGFVESFNLSVSVAVTLYHAHLHRRPGYGELSKSERDVWTLWYYMKCMQFTSPSQLERFINPEQLHQLLSDNLCIH